MIAGRPVFTTPRRRGSNRRSVAAAPVRRSNGTLTTDPIRLLSLDSPSAPLAQLAEQLTLNQRVVGSSPTWRIFQNPRRTPDMRIGPAWGGAARISEARTPHSGLAGEPKPVAMLWVTNSPSFYRYHRAGGPAAVMLAGIDHCLGPYDTRTSRAKSNRLIDLWSANGRRRLPPRRAPVSGATAYLDFRRDSARSQSSRACPSVRPHSSQM
jgi:hypothetical protein